MSLMQVLESLPLVQCSACSRSHTDCQAAANVLMRCCWCREAVYCSEACMRRDEKRHIALHALKCIYLRRDLRFSSSKDFSPLLL